VANGMADQNGIKRRYTAMALAGGLYTAHTLIPPTPGPVAAAGNLGMGGELGLVLGSGLLVSIPILLVLIMGTTWLSRNHRQQTIGHPENLVPHAALLLPVLAAMILISLGSVASALHEGELPLWMSIVVHPVTALFIGTMIAWFQIGVEKRKFTLWKKGTADALPIVLITGMGGAFGQVLKESSLSTSLSETFITSGGTFAHLLLIGFTGALIIKTAQGSSTAAIVITSSILFPLTGGLSGWETALLISAIGSGAMAISHANDSYFWVVSKFSDLSVRESYQYFSVLTLVLGLTGFVSCWILSLI
jgi:GntP family gluconate:H+ symporter